MNMQSKKRVKKTIQSEASIEFNRWAKKLKVSSLWTEDTQEKKISWNVLEMQDLQET